MVSHEVLWSPRPDVLHRSRMGAYLQWLQRQEAGPAVPTNTPEEAYRALWDWSVDQLGEFWQSVWDFFAVEAGRRSSSPLADRALPGARWFPDATLNYADHALRGPASVPSARDDTGRGTGSGSGPRPADQVAVVALSDTRPRQELTWTDLADRVARCRAGLQRLGVGRGDRVAAYLPNVPEATIAFLATASLGAIWSSCPPEFGTRSVVDRLRQIEPKVLVAVDGYRYGDRVIDRSSELAAIRAELPTVGTTVGVPYLDPDRVPEGTLGWDDLLAPDDAADTPSGPPAGEQVPFDHPLYVLYSSGTTGLPKPIVHGHGGILLEHLKALGLHGDLGPGHRFFWFSTTGWMMWNYLMSGLLVGATVVLFDGDPGHPDLGRLWRLAGEEQVTYFGVSAPFLLACRKEGLHPTEVADLSALQTVGSTGAPLPAEGFRWVYDELGPDVLLSSVSGGTDVCTAFVGGHRFSPVRAGLIPTRYLGVKVEAYDATGRPVTGVEGELVVTEPMPSMPVGFWGDDDGSRYRSAYFETHDGVWAHGDWITVHEDGSCEISGRSDATLNRGGVRMGTAELYTVVESLDEVADSLVVHLEDPDGGAGRLLLFVVPAGDSQVDDELRSRVAKALRSALSPRHVPDELYEVPAVPRTLSGKKLEVPVKRILRGADPDTAASRGSLTDPGALDAYVTLRDQLG